MRKNKVHYTGIGFGNWGETRTGALCGVGKRRGTFQPSRVTCRDCKKLMEERDAFQKATKGKANT